VEQSTAEHGDTLFELDPKSSLAILKLLDGYDWPDEIVDIGLTIADHDVPRLGVLTHRHMGLAMAINYHFRGKLRQKL
jgi:hypothetical protein